MEFIEWVGLSRCNNNNFLILVDITVNKMIPNLHRIVVFEYNQVFFLNG